MVSEMAKPDILAKLKEWISDLTVAANLIHPKDTATASKVAAIVKDMSEVLDAMKPREPRTFEDGVAWAKRRAGTYVALLNAEGQLVRTVRVTDQVLKKFSFKTEEREVTVTMKQMLLIVPEAEFEKPIPKSATDARAFIIPEKGADAQIMA